ncbi:flagellar basal-body rod protein FlgF [Geoalkalibacter halelectricus]|uniref:Flagellar basal-body rod protein FlgF n=1 Tax=Geoalkalibacter halelectricus TaxID=2847045 RepID=A0ABY5ZHI2_9BACT|nr:flagellar basal-body rod protein FlgF [Geoalkalibacter halelectricus]MDO3378055.1 flagellar basal-body rod protein FlgF [Geoalkalibacter halelectricus]UWZ78354.1 flagellar basal-body rod protein FlgF [Geoalkalibacter halelectricus]
MSSGVYSVLSGARARMQLLEVVSHNLANADTAGFKKDRLCFESLIDGARQRSLAKGVNFNRSAEGYTDLGQGTIQGTGNPFDLAIEGPGFFKIEGQGGDFYTRQGNFRLDAEGFLVNSGGNRVLGENGPLQLGAEEVRIDEDGRIWDGEVLVGRLAVVEVNDPRLLEKRADGLFAAAPETIEIPVPRPQLLQGHIETSNVNPLQEMTLLMEAHRTFESYTRVMKIYSEINAKADELGSLG